MNRFQALKLLRDYQVLSLDPARSNGFSEIYLYGNTIQAVSYTWQTAYRISYKEALRIIRASFPR